MIPSKIENLLQHSAGSGYDISASRSEATSQAANQQAGSVINFSGRVTSDYADQTATPNATAVAARTAGNTDTASADSSPWHTKIDWPMVAIAAVALLAIGGAIYISQQKAG